MIPRYWSFLGFPSWQVELPQVPEYVTPPHTHLPRGSQAPLSRPQQALLLSLGFPQGRSLVEEEGQGTKQVAGSTRLHSSAQMDLRPFWALLRLRTGFGDCFF